MEGLAFAAYSDTSSTETGRKGEWEDTDVAKCTDLVERRLKEWSLCPIAFVSSVK